MKKFLSDLTILSEEEVEKIHQTSLRILEEIGLHIPNEEILSIIEKNGAEVDWDRSIVRFPESLVMRAVSGVGKDFTKSPAYWDKHIPLGKGEFILWMCSQPEVVELSRNIKRRGTHEDMIKGITVGNVLPNVGLVEPHGLPGEVPPKVVDVYCWRYLYTYARKPCHTWIYSTRSAKYVIEMAKAVAGGEEELKRKKTLLYFAETVSPLRYAPYTLEIMLLMSKYEVPIYIGPMVTAGGSGPVTLAGTVALCNAEILSEIVLVWLLNPNQALVYPGLASIIDLRRGLISYGAPEQALLAIAAVQMAKRYRMACCCNIHLSDSNLADFQRGYEAAATVAFALSAGVEMIGIVGCAGAGFMASNPGCQSLEQLIIDNECADYIKRILRGFEVNDETLAFNLMKKVGVGRTFIGEEHTVRHMREEHFFPTLFNRKSYHEWQADGSTSIAERARKRLEAILAKNYPPDPVIDHTTEKILDEIYREAKGELLS